MAETLVEKQICDTCGADVRTGALFCYHCGGAVAAEIQVVKNVENETAGETPLRKSGDKENENGLQPKAEPVKTKLRDTPGLVEEAKTKPPAEINLQKETPLKSAAAMRDKSKFIQPPKVEVIWEERESSPNVWFILAALLLTILAVGILFMAIRLK